MKTAGSRTPPRVRAAGTVHSPRLTSLPRTSGFTSTASLENHAHQHPKPRRSLPSLALTARPRLTQPCQWSAQAAHCHQRSSQDSMHMTADLLCTNTQPAPDTNNNCSRVTLRRNSILPRLSSRSENDSCSSLPEDTASLRKRSLSFLVAAGHTGCAQIFQPMDVTLFGKCIFAGEMKFRISR